MLCVLWVYGVSFSLSLYAMSITTLDEASVEFLECARYGEAEDLLACLAFGVDVNYKDPAGNTALHRGKCCDSMT